VAEAAARQSLEDSVRKQVNVAQAISHAEEALRDDPQAPPEKKIDDDWLYRWRDYAGDVSAESMQQLWGSVLAGEVKSPGSFSLRTLEFLRSLSQSEAQQIERLSQFVLDDILWRDDSLESLGLTFSLLMAMQDLGIISGVEALGLEMHWDSVEKAKFLRALQSHGKVLLIRHDDPRKKLSLPAYLLTGIGKEILQLGRFQPNVDYMQRVGAAVQKAGFSVSIADFVRVSANTIRFFNETSIEVQQEARADVPASGRNAA
jgi:hypothetical protein